MKTKRRRKLLAVLVAALLAWFLVSAAAIAWSGLADATAREVLAYYAYLLRT